MTHQPKRNDTDILSKLPGLDGILKEQREARAKRCKCGAHLEPIGEPSFYSRLKLLGCPVCHLVYWYSPEQLEIKDS